jgi:hypothetical protein
MLEQIFAVAMTASAFRDGTLVQPGVTFMFGMTTQTGDLFRDAGCVMKVMAGVARTAGAIHRRG